jgi:hypothetical protein
LVEPNIECKTDSVRAITDEPVDDLVGPLDRCAADDNAADSLSQQIIDRGYGSYATPNLQPHGSLRGEGDNDGAIREHTFLGAIEIDNVQPGRTQPAIADQQLVRLVLVPGFSREVALKQAYAATVA